MAAGPAGPAARMPWLDQEMPAKAPIDPSKNHRTLDDFFLPETPRSVNWGDQAVGRFKQGMPETGETRADYDLHVFISKSMPEGALRLMFQQAKDLPPGRVRFVLRGFEPQQVGPLISHFRRLFPDPLTDDFIIEIDPVHFRDYNIDTVPAYLVKDQDKWFQARGMASLHGVIENVRRRGPKMLGETYPVEEPDVLAIIEDRAKKFDWQSATKRAKERMARNLSPKFDLPTVLEDAETFFRPVFKVPHDIEVPATDKNPRTLLAAAGTEIRILDHTRLQVPIIVIDANDARQVAMLQRWQQGPLAKADVFVVGGYQDGQTEPNFSELSKQMKKVVYPWQNRMSERFGVQAVPAVVEQVGDQLRIRYVKPSN